MSCFIVGLICLLVGAFGGMVITSLMVAAGNENRCRECIEYKEKCGEKC